MTTVPCETQLGPGYYFTILAAIFDLLAAILGVVVIFVVWGRHWKQLNVDNDDLLAEPDPSVINATGSDVIYQEQHPRPQMSDVLT